MDIIECLFHRPKNGAEITMPSLEICLIGYEDTHTNTSIAAIDLIDSSSVVMSFRGEPCEFGVSFFSPTFYPQKVYGFDIGNLDVNGNLDGEFPC